MRATSAACAVTFIAIVVANVAYMVFDLQGPRMGPQWFNWASIPAMALFLGLALYLSERKP